MPGLVEAKSSSRVMFVPEEAMEGSTSEDTAVKMVKLRHPKTEEPALFMYNPTTPALFEVLSFSEEHRSWFIGERIVSDGKLYLATPVDPRFLVLPYFKKSTRLVPLDQLLDDKDYPMTEEILIRFSSKLESVADQKGSKDLNVWQLDETKTVEWLEGRVERVAKALGAQKIDLTSGAVAATYKQTANSDVDMVEYRRCALGIVSDYLADDLADKLKVRLGLPEPKAGVKRTSSAGDSQPSKKRKSAAGEGPAEDYSSEYKKPGAKEAEKSAKQKALAKSAEGTKNIMSFFKKK